jgi:DNA-binding IclR family transcriptional regulator
MEESVQVIHRALDILEQLSQSSKPIGPTEISKSTGISKSTVCRLLSTLQARSYVEKRSPDGKYSIGPKLIALVSRHIGSLELQTEARPYLSLLASDLNLTTHLGILDGNEVIYVEKLDHIPTKQLYSQIGYRVPAYCSSLGKCLLSRYSGEDLKNIMGCSSFRIYTRNTIPNIEALKEQLRRIRDEGWAMDNEEYEVGHMCVGAPVYDYRGEIIAAVSASGTSTVITPDYLPVIVDEVKQTSKQISKCMGYLA